MVRKSHIALGVLSVLLLGVGSASADGAFAVGSTGLLGQDGIAMGYAVNARSSADATNSAIQRCREFDAPKANKRCVIAATFRNECLAVALDPTPGMNGTGWSFGPSKQAAEQRAMAVCKATANPGRESACRIMASVCDGI